MIPIGAVEVQHDPVIRALRLMGSRRVRKQRRIVSVATLAVQDRQPRLALGIEAPWCNELEFPLLCLTSILSVHIEYFGNARHIAMDIVRRAANSTESTRQRIADAGKTLGAETYHVLEPPVMRGDLQLLQCVDMEQIMYARCRMLADAWNRGNHLYRIGIAS
jgi:hypothetical protein